MNTEAADRFDPVNMDPALRSTMRDCIHGRHARKCPECDLVIELRESGEAARRAIAFARRAVELWHARPFEDVPLNQIMVSLDAAARNLAEYFPEESA